MEISHKLLMDWTRRGMRKSFGPMMEVLAQRNDRLIVMVADVAHSAGLDGFAEAFPNRFFNMGIAEQNMTGVATGMAKEGYNVFIVSFGSFVSMRNYEAIRTLAGYMHANVKVVALASGLSLGIQGSTHYGLEDLSLMRTIPGMLILSPADCREELKCLEFLAEYDGPAFLRLTGIDGSPLIHREDFTLSMDMPMLLREGTDVAIFSTGSVVSECIRASRALKKNDISCAVYEVTSMKPSPLRNMEELLEKYRLLVSVEEHFAVGGLGSMLSEFLSSNRNYPPLLRIGIGDGFPKAGDYGYMMESCGLNAENIRNRIITAIKE